MRNRTTATIGLLAIVSISWFGCSTALTPHDGAGLPLATEQGTAGSWTWQGYDLAGSRCVPHSSKAKLGTAAFASKWHCPGSVALTGDVNGDGRPELVTSDGTKVRVFDAKGNCLSAFDCPGGLEMLGDVNKDSKSEILVSCATADQASIEAYDASGRRIQSYVKLAREAGLSANALGELNGDGKVELLAMCGSGYSGSLRGFSVFDAASGKEIKHYRTGSGNGLASLGRLADGKLRIIQSAGSPANGFDGEDSGDDSSSYVRCFDGSLNLLWRQGPFNSGGFYDSSAQIADLNGDGKGVVVATASSHGWREFDGQIGRLMLLSIADGSVLQGCDRDFGEPVSVVSVADLEGKGKKHILLLHEDRQHRKYLIEAVEPTPGLRTVWQFDAGETCPTLCAGNDLNGDGRPEVIVRNGANLYVLSNDLKLLWKWSREQPILSAIVSDLDGDGANEIIVASGSTPDTRQVDVLTGRPAK